MTVGIGGRIELGVMAGGWGPGPREVIGHEVDEVEMATCLSEVDVPQGPLPCGKSRCEGVRGERERGSQRGEELNVVISLLGVGWMFPVDYGRVVSDETYLMFSRSKIVLLSMPLRPYLSTRLLALWAKVNRVLWLEATCGKLALFSPPPPMDRSTLSCGYCNFNLFMACKQPLVPSTSI